MTSTSKYSKHNAENDPSIASPLTCTATGDLKPSFKSTKLARRARSFKDDIFGKISQMRSPGCAPAMRPQSPNDCQKSLKTKQRVHPKHTGPIQELDELWRQIQLALKHFHNVITKKTLVMLPGNGTIVLDHVWHINLAIKSAALADPNGRILAATNEMYESVARLIKLCDDVLIDADSSQLNVDNVNQILDQVKNSILKLIRLVQEKIKQQHKHLSRTTPRTSLCNSSLEISTQRNSLPDIPLTPREKEELGKVAKINSTVYNSHSSESILRDSPPPKPPLPNGIKGLALSQVSLSSPPPLPPKKKTNRFHYTAEDISSLDYSASCLERISLRSKSPEDSISIPSGSESLDSVLNISSREDELLDDFYDHQNDFFDTSSCNIWEESSSRISSLTHAQYDYHRLSNTDSGIVSNESYRSSNYARSLNTVQVLKCENEMVKSKKSLSKENLTQTSLFVQNISPETTSNLSPLPCRNMSSGDETDLGIHSSPPPIPEKTVRKSQTSPYDNVMNNEQDEDLLVACQMHKSQVETSIVDEDKPPPLPQKKRHMFQSVAYSVMAYMEMFGNCSHAGDQDYARHSLHLTQANHWMQTTAIPTTQSCSFNQKSQTSTSSSHFQIDSSTTSSPSSNADQRVQSPLRPQIISPFAIRSTAPTTPPALPPKQRSRHNSSVSPLSSPITPEANSQYSPQKVLPDLLEHTTAMFGNKHDNESKDVKESLCDINLMEETDVDKWLVFKKKEEEGPDIKGGAIDALIVQATKATINGVLPYQEAFLTTYRTFISPYNLLAKLIKRYIYFCNNYENKKKARSRETFALIVRVVSDLTLTDLNNAIQRQLMDFVQHLISCGELTLAKALRIKFLEKHETVNKKTLDSLPLSILTTPKTVTLLDFKSEQIAEQMTLLDADLFMKIEIPEVLIWAQEQNEERSPNLTLFTEHFNKMSYWARTKILECSIKETREKLFSKFIKIMKHLRKLNNFNSYLALLSALDSAPVRRLEWQKNVQDGLKDYCALIDSSSSFRAYRQALAETQPPCIPYIGLILQDLTFVHIGNNNLLPDGLINFSKRWQQFNIVENMKKFRKSTYSFKKNEKIIQYFANFDHVIAEEKMWQLSESIKPRGTKKTQQLNH